MRRRHRSFLECVPPNCLYYIYIHRRNATSVVHKFHFVFANAPAKLRFCVRVFFRDSLLLCGAPSRCGVFALPVIHTLLLGRNAAARILSLEFVWLSPLNINPMDYVIRKTFML